MLEVSSGITPLYNLKYRDFGNLAEFNRIVMKGSQRSLSVAERVLTSRAVVFDTLVKSSIRKANFHTGHCITFLHEGATEISNILACETETLPRKSFTKGDTEVLKMAFVGTPNQWKRIKSSPETRAAYFRKQPQLVLRASVIKDYLEFKSAMDSNYADVEITSTLQSEGQLAEQLVLLQDELLETAIECDAEKEIVLDEQLHDNVATESTDRQLSSVINQSTEGCVTTDSNSLSTNNEAPGSVDFNLHNTPWGKVNDEASVQTHAKIKVEYGVDDTEVTLDDANVDCDDDDDGAKIDFVFMSPTVKHGSTSVSAFLDTVKRHCFPDKLEDQETDYYGPDFDPSFTNDFDQDDFEIEEDELC